MSIDYIHVSWSDLLQKSLQTVAFAGAAYALVGFNEMLAYLLCSVAFLTIYPATVNFFRGFVWDFGAGVLLISVVLITWVLSAKEVGRCVKRWLVPRSSPCFNLPPFLAEVMAFCNAPPFHSIYSWLWQHKVRMSTNYRADHTNPRGRPLARFLAMECGSKIPCRQYSNYEILQGDFCILD